MADKIGVGVIGANPDESWAAFSHLPALEANPDYDVLAVSTTRAETAAKAAEKYGAAGYDNHVDLINHPGVELVVIAVKVPYHRELTLAALEAGKHVYTEWPLGNGTEEAVEMADLAREKGVVAVVGLQGRLSPAVLYARDLIKQGYVGEVLSTSVTGTSWVWGATVSTHNAYHVDKSRGVTLLTIQTGHFLDYLAWTLDLELTDLVASFATVRPQITVEETGETLTVTGPDQIAVSGTLSNGALAAVHVRGGQTRGTNLLWEVNGTEGDLVIRGDSIHVSTDDHGAPTLLGARGDETEVVELPIPDEYRYLAAGTPDGPPYNIGQFYTKLASDLRDGTGYLPTFDHAVRRHRLLDAIERAAETGSRQSYDYSDEPAVA